MKNAYVGVEKYLDLQDLQIQNQEGLKSHVSVMVLNVKYVGIQVSNLFHVFGDLEMIRRWEDKGKTKDHIKNYSKVFKKALRHCNIDESKHLHSLRHSYALRRRLETNGNYQLVAKELGHKSAIVTEKYQRCDEKKLWDDFPSYRAILESLENGVFNITSTKNTSTKSYYKPHYSLRQLD